MIFPHFADWPGNVFRFRLRGSGRHYGRVLARNRFRGSKAGALGIFARTGRGEMPIVKQLVVTLDNRPGAFATLCSELAKVAVNIEAVQAGEAGPISPVRLIVRPVDAAQKVCERLGLKSVVESALAVGVGHRPGSLGRLMRKMAAKGINVEYVYGTIARDTKRALVIMGVSDLAAASKIAH